MSRADSRLHVDRNMFYLLLKIESTNIDIVKKGTGQVQSLERSRARTNKTKSTRVTFKPLKDSSMPSIDLRVRKPMYRGEGGERSNNEMEGGILGYCCSKGSEGGVNRW